MKQPSRFRNARRLLLFWTIFVGVRAVSGALAMLLDPSGRWMGMDAMLPYFQVLPFAQVLFQDLSRYDHVTVCSAIWAFHLAPPVRSFCRQAAGHIREADYILVHHQNSVYENAAREMDSLLGLHRTALRSVRCRKGVYRTVYPAPEKSPNRESLR